MTTGEVIQLVVVGIITIDEARDILGITQYLNQPEAE